MIFFGDLNYRVRGLSLSKARQYLSRMQLQNLREHDELAEELRFGPGGAFAGFVEARPDTSCFVPTYKVIRQLSRAVYGSVAQCRCVVVWSLVPMATVVAGHPNATHCTG